MLKSYYKTGVIECGIDEAGRGCCAGPVFAAAVILPPDFSNEELNDSKKLTESKRYKLREVIEKEAVCWAVASIDNEEIDKINILQATYKAMHKAIGELKIKPELLLIDGNRFKTYPGILHQCFVKGDGTFASIAAASILAKTYRDDFMKKLHDEYPEYNWKQNKGYCTADHINAMKIYGNTKYHRLSFHIKPKQLKLEFYTD